MTAERVSRLQALLERVRRNAVRPRSSANLRGPAAEAAPEVTSASSAAVSLADLGEPVASSRIVDLEQDQSVGEVPSSTPVSSATEVAISPVLPSPSPLPPITQTGLEQPLEELDFEETEVVELGEDGQPLVAEADQPPAASQDEEIPVVVDQAPAWSTATEGTEEAPISSQRARVSAESLDQALASVADAVPGDTSIMTPPPESGQQISSVQPAMPESLEVELTPSMRATPTPEQLGETIDLGDTEGPALELAEEPPPEGPTAPDQLEFVPPRGPELAARQEMPTLAGTTGQESAPQSSPSAPAVSVTTLEAEQAVPPVAEVTGRPSVPPSGPVVAVEAEPRPLRPATFLELLDASLQLVQD